MALSSRPSVDLILNRHRTSAGSPHRSLPSWSKYAGQSRNITGVSIAGSFEWVFSARPTASVWSGAARDRPAGYAGAHYGVGPGARRQVPVVAQPPLGVGPGATRAGRGSGVRHGLGSASG